MLRQLLLVVLLSPHALAFVRPRCPPSSWRTVTKAASEPLRAFGPPPELSNPMSRPATNSNDTDYDDVNKNDMGFVGVVSGAVDNVLEDASDMANVVTSLGKEKVNEALGHAVGEAYGVLKDETNKPAVDQPKVLGIGEGFISQETADDKSKDLTQAVLDPPVKDRKPQSEEAEDITEKWDDIHDAVKDYDDEAVSSTSPPEEEESPTKQ